MSTLPALPDLGSQLPLQSHRVDPMRVYHQAFADIITAIQDSRTFIGSCYVMDGLMNPRSFDVVTIQVTGAEDSVPPDTNVCRQYVEDRQGVVKLGKEVFGLDSPTHNLQLGQYPIGSEVRVRLTYERLEKSPRMRYVSLRAQRMP